MLLSTHTSRAFPQDRIRVERPALGTRVVLEAFADSARAEYAIESAYQEIYRLEALLSSFRENSDIGRLNRARGLPVPVGPETLEVLERALWASRVSHGAFDITFQVMSALWRFGDAAQESPRVPTDGEVARRRLLIDYQRIELDLERQTVRIPLGMQVSLGGIGKGYIVDRAARVLRENGLDSFFLQAGGDLLSVGRKPSGREWRSGVQDPRGPRGEIFATIDFSDHAFSTAGDYVHTYLAEGRRYHHIIDPRTGYPATACRSVTVWAKDAVTADALDDAVFVLGPEAGLELVEETPGVGAVIVDAENRILVSRRLSGRLRILCPPTDGV